MNPVQLALRVLRVDARSRLSAVLTAAGVAVATALILLLASLPGATDARMERSAWQTGAAEEHGVTMASRDFFQNETIVRMDVSGTADPENPGPAYPGPGEVLLSPRLAELAEKHPDQELGGRFTGKVIGTIDENWLKFPEQLVAIVGHPPGTLDADRAEFSGSAAVGDSDVMLQILAGVGIVVLAIPSMVLVASAARLTAARRERRLAALRLAGATPGQVVGVVAAETAVAAVTGTVVGLLLSWPLRYVAARIPWGDGTWMASDFTPSVLIVAAFGLVIPTMVVLAAVLGLRRVVRTPLGAAMNQTRKRPKAWRLLALVGAAGFFVFGLATAEETGGMGVLLAALAAVLLSASIVGPWLTGVLGSLFAAGWRKPSVLLAGRRLSSDPQAAYRSVSGIVLSVFVGTMALTLLPSFEGFAGGGRSYKDEALYLDVPTAQAVEQEKRIREGLAASGVDAVVAGIEQVQLEAPDGQFASGLVIDCQTATSLTRINVGDCAGPPAIRAAASKQLPSTGLTVQASQPTGASIDEMPKVALPGEIPMRPLGANEDSDLDYTVLIDPALVPELAGGETTLVVNPANDADREKVRTVLAAAAPGESFNSRELRLYDQQTLLGDLKRVTAIGLGLTALLAGCSAAITAASSVVDRRRTFAALIAAGTPIRMLSRALRTEAALPALVATIGAGAAGIAVAVGIFGLFSSELPVVFNGWLFAPVVIGLIVAMIAASSSGPMLRRISADRISEE